MVLKVVNLTRRGSDGRPHRYQVTVAYEEKALVDHADELAENMPPDMKVQHRVQGPFRYITRRTA